MPAALDPSLYYLANFRTALAWIGDCLEFGIARFEAVYLAHMLAAWTQDDAARLAHCQRTDHDAGCAGIEQCRHVIACSYSTAGLHLQGHIPQSGGGAVVDGNVADFKHGAFPGKR